eukprot:655730-Rhodomonas_salina.1
MEQSEKGVGPGSRRAMQGAARNEKERKQKRRGETTKKGAAATRQVAREMRSRGLSQVRII